MYVIFFSEKAKKQLGKLEHSVQERIFHALDKIKIRPEAFVTKLVGDPAYKLRVGDYRVLLDINNEKLLLLVIKIGHRKNVYD